MVKEMLANNKKKDCRVSILRIICVLLVVFSHSIIIYKDGWDHYSTNVTSDLLNYLCQFIYLFHMPLFFSLSGYLAYYSYKRKKKFIDYVIKKFKRLIVPFLCIAFFYMLPIRYISHYPGYINNSFFYNVFVNILLVRDAGYLWFLPTLFFCYLLHFLMMKYSKNEMIIFVISIIMFSFSSLLPGCIGRIFSNYIWFNMGYLISKYSVLRKTKLVRYSSWLFFVIFVVLYFLFSERELLKIITRFLVAFSAILLMYSSIPDKKPSKIMTSLENNSFGIYLFHPPLIYLVFFFMPNIHPCLMIFINFIILGSVSWLMSNLLRKTKVKFVLGE